METKIKPTLYWSLLKFQGWNFYIASTSKGLVFVGSQNNPFEELFEWAKKCFPGSPLVEDDEKLEPYILGITQYLEGKRNTFTVPFEYVGTQFQLAVWNALCDIPYGKTKSYSDIANDIKKPTAVRAVGTAIAANPVLIAVPCHRVIGKNGSLTGYRGGLEMKTLLLDLEKRASSSTE
ncbi:methylated-DNA--[protein]-cysteine S-methyltransferase [Mesobacillus sp. AQ2]|uniref:methylated-DNA--[protein]-cysteine S-methyltransferase n=1 Tax=Mesobacillus sp. AQ2 TaxID=3043332 RepID=UPI0024C1C926|nr:methylated-DNA--[protein]-cysteine S-methyltransferase [Mesobacillus sp. AQ2]WHX39789.1 methylated-DNA--[protein]-cysteine S-methyltransferase [Mesobacillus sp. AQ2]